MRHYGRAGGRHDLLKWIKDNEHFRVVPILVISSSALRADVLDAYRSGANAYLVKPSDNAGYQNIAAAIYSFWSLCEKPDFRLVVPEAERRPDPTRLPPPPPSAPWDGTRARM